MLVKQHTKRKKSVFRMNHLIQCLKHQRLYKHINDDDCFLFTQYAPRHNEFSALN